MVAVNIARAFGLGIAAALRAVVAVGGVDFRACPFDAVNAEAVVEVGRILEFAAAVVLVKRRVFFISVVGKPGFVMDDAFILGSANI